MGVCGNVCCVALKDQRGDHMGEAYSRAGLMTYHHDLEVLYPYCVGVFRMFAVMSLQLLRGRIWDCMKCPYLCLCWDLR